MCNVAAIIRYHCITKVLSRLKDTVKIEKKIPLELVAARAASGTTGSGRLKIAWPMLRDVTVTYVLIKSDFTRQMKDSTIYRVEGSQPRAYNLFGAANRSAGISEHLIS
eukprot:6185154-Pleurochrysis_carterae.AAC.4